MLVLVVAVVAHQAWAWNRLARRVASGALTRSSAILRCALWAHVPPCGYVAAFLGAVGLEEWWGVALISEPMGRAALPVGALLLGLAGLGSLSFGVRCVLLKPTRRGG